LPGEIRNKIYAYHYDTLVIDVCKSTSDKRKYSTCTSDGSGRYLTKYGANACGLLSACRQLNADCRSLLFQYATLRVEDPEGFLQFLGDLDPAHLSVIHTIHIPRVSTPREDRTIAFNYRLYVEDRGLFLLNLKRLVRYTY